MNKFMITGLSKIMIGLLRTDFNMINVLLFKNKIVNLPIKSKFRIHPFISFRHSYIFESYLMILPIKGLNIVGFDFR